MPHFTIYRDSWRRGGDGGVDNSLKEQFGDTQLLNNKNMMCCLGQCAYQAGVPLVYLGESEPSWVSSAYEDNLESAGLINVEKYEDGDTHRANTSFSNAAMPINDDEDIDDSQRENQLILLAKIHGHALTFVDGPAPWFNEVAK